MKFPLFISYILLFINLFVHQAHGQEIGYGTSQILSEIKAETEKYQSLANEPIPVILPEDQSILSYQDSLNSIRLSNGESGIRKLKSLLASTNTPFLLKKEIHATLGFIYLGQNRPKEALEEFSHLEQEAEFRERAIFGIAWGFLQQEEYVKAIAIFDDLVDEFPNGQYTSEALSKIGFCYSKLLSYKNAVESYQKALHLANQQLLTQKVLFQTSGHSIVFQKDFLFNSRNPDWKTFLKKIKDDPEGFEVLQETEKFFNLEERVNLNPIIRKSSPQFQQNLLEIKTQIQDLFQKFINEQFKKERKISQDFSSEIAVELARNMILEQSVQGQNSGLR